MIGAKMCTEKFLRPYSAALAPQSSVCACMCWLSCQCCEAALEPITKGFWSIFVPGSSQRVYLEWLCQPVYFADVQLQDDNRISIACARAGEPYAG